MSHKKPFSYVILQDCICFSKWTIPCVLSITIVLWWRSCRKLWKHNDYPLKILLLLRLRNKVLLQREGDMCILTADSCCWYGRNQHSIVKQLSSSEKETSLKKIISDEDASEKDRLGCLRDSSGSEIRPEHSCFELPFSRKVRSLCLDAPLWLDPATSLTSCFGCAHLCPQKQHLRCSAILQGVPWPALPPFSLRSDVLPGPPPWPPTSWSPPVHCLQRHEMNWRRLVLSDSSQPCGR